MDYTNNTVNIDSIKSNECISISNTNLYELCLTTVDSEINKMILNIDEKSAVVKKVSSPTFFFTNILP